MKKKLNHYIYGCVNQNTNRVSLSVSYKAHRLVLYECLISGLIYCYFEGFPSLCDSSVAPFFFLNHPHESHLVLVNLVR